MGKDRAKPGKKPQKKLPRRLAIDITEPKPPVPLFTKAIMLDGTRVVVDNISAWTVSYTGEERRQLLNVRIFYAGDLGSLLVTGDTAIAFLTHPAISDTAAILAHAAVQVNNLTPTDLDGTEFEQVLPDVNGGSDTL